MHQQNVALLFDPSEKGALETVSQFSSAVRDLCNCLPLPADRHLPARVEELSIDAAVNLVHDIDLAARVAALCRLLELPSTGPSPLAHLAADRALFKDWLGIHNFATPASYLARNPVERLAHDHRNFGFPVWVRTRTDSHAAVARSLGELEAQVLALRAQNGPGGPGEVQIERLVAGSVVCTALWRGQAVGSAELCAGEDAAGGRIEELHIPARIPATGLKTMERLAERIAELFSAREAMLVTTVRSDQQETLVLDVDPLPRLHRDERFCRIAGAYGLSLRECARQLLSDLNPQRSSRLATRSAWICG